MSRRRKCIDCWWFNQRTETTGWCIYRDRYRSGVAPVFVLPLESEVDEYTCFKDRELCNKYGTLKELCEAEDIEYIDYIKNNDE